MKNDCGTISLAMVVALAKKCAIQYGALGVLNVQASGTNGIKFTMSDGSVYTITLSFNASGVSFDNSGTTATATNVQDALVALFGMLPTIQAGSDEGKMLVVKNGTISLSDRNEVRMMTGSDMLDALTSGKYHDGTEIEIGQIVTPLDDTEYAIGDLFQFVSGSPFEWVDVSPDRKSVYNAYIVGDTEFSSTWISLSVGGSALIPSVEKVYVIKTAGVYYNKSYMWNNSSSAYELVGDGGGSSVVITHETISGWDVATYSNTGDKIAMVQFDIEASSQEMMSGWDSALSGWKMSLTLPSVFSTIDNVDVKCIDTTLGRAVSEKNPLTAYWITLPTASDTGMYFVGDRGSCFSQTSYTLPSRITVRIEARGR